MKKIILFFLSLLTLIGFSMAWELNNSNLSTYCPNPTSRCELGDLWITSIATWTFIWRSDITTLELNGNQISSLLPWNFS